MPYSIAQPGMFEVLDADCTFAIPAINDNTRKTALLQCGVATFSTIDHFVAGDIVYGAIMHGPLGQRFYATANQSNGKVGVAVGPTITGVVPVQIMGQAMVRSANLTNLAHVGKYLGAHGFVVGVETQIMSANLIIGKITGVIDSRHYEVLLHALPDFAVGAVCPGGLPYPQAAQSAVDYGASFSVREATVHWYDDRKGHGHGEDNYMITQGKNTLIAEFLRGPADKIGNQWPIRLHSKLVSGSASVMTYSHKSFDNAPTVVTYDIRPEIVGDIMTLYLRSTQTALWEDISEFDARIRVAGWWSI